MCLFIDFEETERLKAKHPTGMLDVYKVFDFFVPENILKSPFQYRVYEPGVNYSYRGSKLEQHEITDGEVRVGLHCYYSFQDLKDDWLEWNRPFLFNVNRVCLKLKALWKHFIAIGYQRDMVFSQLYYPKNWERCIVRHTTNN